jgi:hypothetical protein
VYLAVSALAGSAFVICAFWSYHYLDVEDESDDDFLEETESKRADQGTQTVGGLSLQTVGRTELASSGEA